MKKINSTKLCNCFSQGKAQNTAIAGYCEYLQRRIEEKNKQSGGVYFFSFTKWHEVVILVRFIDKISTTTKSSWLFHLAFNITDTSPMLFLLPFQDYGMSSYLKSVIKQNLLLLHNASILQEKQTLNIPKPILPPIPQNPSKQYANQY